MSIEDHRRRLTGSAESTGQLSVAELIARREAETMPIPVITDDITPEAFEPTIRFKSVTTPDAKHPGSKPRKQPARELHITELLRREGRSDDTQRGGFTVGKLAAAASGGVVLAGTVAFAASSWLASPDERPLAQVQFDDRAQARGASAGTEGVVKLPSNKPPQSDTTETAGADPTTEQEQVRVAPYTQQQQQRPTQQTQQPTPQQPTTQSPTTTTPSTETSTTNPSTPPSSDTPPPPPSSSDVKPPSSNTPPPPSSTENPLPTPSNPVDVSVDLGLLDPVLNTVGDAVGGFDFFAPAK